MAAAARRDPPSRSAPGAAAAPPLLRSVGRRRGESRQGRHLQPARPGGPDAPVTLAHACPRARFFGRRVWTQISLWGGGRKLRCSRTLIRACRHGPTPEPTCTCSNPSVPAHTNTQAYGHKCSHTLYTCARSCMFTDAHLRTVHMCSPTHLPATHLCMCSHRHRHHCAWCS